MEHLDILIRLLIAHFLGDFLLQSQHWVVDRRKKKLGSVFLYLHISIHGVLTYLLLADWSNYLLPVILMATHFIIDILKTKWRNLPWLFIGDQIIHLTVIGILWMIFYGDWQLLYEWTIAEGGSTAVWIIILAYLLVISPASVTIRIFIEKYRPENRKTVDGFKERNAESELPGLRDAGRAIGILERVLIVTFILLQQYAIIGFLIAAKSVLRYGEIKSNSDRQHAEYILIGTLLSFVFAIAIGVVAYCIINHL